MRRLPGAMPGLGRPTPPGSRRVTVPHAPTKFGIPLMLNFFSRNSAATTCEGVSRRAFLTAGALSVGGLTLADLLRAQAAQAAPKSRGKAVIMVYLNGGPSHMDTYDL